LKAAEWRRQVPEKHAPVFIKNSLAQVMSYDGKHLVAITQVCSQTDRKTEFMEQRILFYPNSASSSFIQGLICDIWTCNEIRSFAKDYLRPNSESHVAHQTDWFSEGGYGMQDKKESYNCRYVWSFSLGGFVWTWTCDERVIQTYITKYDAKNSEMRCPYGRFVNSIRCFDSKCEFRQLYCKLIQENIGMAQDPNDVEYITVRILGTQTCSKNYHLIGLKCRGARCLNIQLICAKVEVSVRLRIFASLNINVDTHKNIITMFLSDFAPIYSRV